MTTKQRKQEQPTNTQKLRWITAILFISLSINLYLYHEWFPVPVHIPNQHQINNFCQQKNYDYGWLSSSSCQENQVMCYRKAEELAQYTCLEWEINETR